ncbi:unnamed protein product [Schistosoma margrebowiei]|uniref:Uncharacterized protein n=1 Tax=Schistosoma margrebowiei TaxID=48269 RepID=A0A183MX02_9TREM|nr:unnamed protein product [Schistosoma margrebowiei]
MTLNCTYQSFSIYTYMIFVFWRMYSTREISRIINMWNIGSRKRWRWKRPNICI